MVRISPVLRGEEGYFGVTNAGIGVGALRSILRGAVRQAVYPAPPSARKVTSSVNGCRSELQTFREVASRINWDDDPACPSIPPAADAWARPEAVQRAGVVQVQAVPQVAVEQVQVVQRAAVAAVRAVPLVAGVPRLEAVVAAALAGSLEQALVAAADSAAVAESPCWSGQALAGLPAAMWGDYCPRGARPDDCLPAAAKERSAAVRRSPEAYLAAAD